MLSSGQRSCLIRYVRIRIHGLGDVMKKRVVRRRVRRFASRIGQERFKDTINVFQRIAESGMFGCVPEMRASMV